MAVDLIQLTLMGVITIKKMILLLLGFIPLIIGFLMNSWIIDNPDSVLPSNLIGIIFLVLWIVVGFISFTFEKSQLKSFLIVHLPAIAMFVLLMYQEMIVGGYWSNLLGVATQFYFMPMIGLAHSLISIFIFTTKGLWLMCLLALLLMVVAFYLGNYFRKSWSR
ncbi:hypothetical protein [Oceanobacillus sp. CAU 1775]